MSVLMVSEENITKGYASSHLTLRVTEAAVELQHFWPLLGQHQPSIQHTYDGREEAVRVLLFGKETLWGRESRFLALTNAVTFQMF